MDLNNEQWLIQAQQLDPTALKMLHAQFYGPVARYIRFKVSDPQTAEDLTGEVFVRMLEGLKRGQGWRDSPKGWIMGIARNVVVDHYRRRARMPETTLDDRLASSAEADPRQKVLQNERLEQLRQAIARLTDEQRDVILMRFMEGVDIKGVAQAIQKTPGAVKGLQYRALRALAEILQESTDNTESI
ncbi:MAG: sigma-70 family RNA polymerase sigma factor [Chloroflexi bacterium]|nr:MAG: sigma-70 family RNA polymerase sigma factor [Chloroflexota bacterium]